jgi:iron(II)-dependent oxidoreductase
VLDFEAPQIESSRMRRVGKALLSLALIDARNHTLRWSRAFDDALARVPKDGSPKLALPQDLRLDSPEWLLGHIGWFQEQVVARNVQRHRGEHADMQAPRLASIDPSADAWYDPAQAPPSRRTTLQLPLLDSMRHYLVETLETTLELLERADDSDDALYFFRLALFHEDLLSEAFAVLAQATGFDAKLTPGIANVPPRDALLFPASSWSFGSDAEGFAFDHERPAHAVAVPEFEIDAQAVSWAQYCEFVEDGGYDEARFWSTEGWDWVQREGRRCPRHVDQMRQSVLLQRFGRATRVLLSQPAVHVSWYEADAWCRWAGRRLPTEVEWEMAASTGPSRGFRWGSVWEWTAGAFRPYPGYVAGPWAALIPPRFGERRVLRGASFATRERVRNAKHRNAQPADSDHVFAGFRSCVF